MWNNVTPHQISPCVPAYILYDGTGSDDGFLSVYAARMGRREQATYIPVCPGEAFPEIPDNAFVYILGCTYDRETLLSLADRSQLVMIIDHREAAGEILESVRYSKPNLVFTFKPHKSTAVLTYEFFVSDSVPKMFQYIQDRELGRWELPRSREFLAYVDKQLPRTHESWHHCDWRMYFWPEDFDTYADWGADILNHQAYVLYRGGGSLDGFGAAWVAYKTLRDSAIYIPVEYEDLLPEIPDGARVWIFGASYNQESLVNLADRCKFVVVKDHREPATKLLKGLKGARPNLDVEFDAECSAAILARHYFRCGSGGSSLILVDFLNGRAGYRHLPSGYTAERLLSVEPRAFERWSEIDTLLEKGLDSDRKRWIKRCEAKLADQATHEEQ